MRYQAVAHVVGKELYILWGGAAATELRTSVFAGGVESAIGTAGYVQGPVDVVHEEHVALDGFIGLPEEVHAVVVVERNLLRLDLYHQVACEGGDGEDVVLEGIAYALDERGAAHYDRETGVCELVVLGRQDGHGERLVGGVADAFLRRGDMYVRSGDVCYIAVTASDEVELNLSGSLEDLADGVDGVGHLELGDASRTRVGVAGVASIEVCAVCGNEHTAGLVRLVVGLVTAPCVLVVNDAPDEHTVSGQALVPACFLSVLEIVHRIRGVVGLVVAIRRGVEVIFGGFHGDVLRAVEVGRSNPAELVFLEDGVVGGSAAAVVIAAGRHDIPFAGDECFAVVGSVLSVVVVGLPENMAELVAESANAATLRRTIVLQFRRAGVLVQAFAVEECLGVPCVALMRPDKI